MLPHQRGPRAPEGQEGEESLPRARGAGNHTPMAAATAAPVAVKSEAKPAMVPIDDQSSSAEVSSLTDRIFAFCMCRSAC